MNRVSTFNLVEAGLQTKSHVRGWSRENEGSRKTIGFIAPGGS